jgi:hypothetical protein
MIVHGSLHLVEARFARWIAILLPTMPTPDAG